MSDVSIRQTAVTSAPLDYKVPGAQEILPKAVSASMDGTSAGSAWFPCLQLLDPAGNVMFSAISQTSVAAGASADVTWFPKLATTAAATTGGSNWTWAEMSSPSSVTVNAGTTKILDMSSLNIYTNDSTVFGIGSQVISATTYHGIAALKDGHYLGKGQIEITGFQAANSGHITVLWESEPGSPASYGSAGATLNCPVAVDSGNWDPYIEVLTTVDGGSTDIFLIQVSNTTSVNVTMYMDMIAVRLDPDNTHIF